MKQAMIGKNRFFDPTRPFNCLKCNGYHSADEKCNGSQKTIGDFEDGEKNNSICI